MPLSCLGALHAIVQDSPLASVFARLLQSGACTFCGHGTVVARASRSENIGLNEEEGRMTGKADREGGKRVKAGQERRVRVKWIEREGVKVGSKGEWGQSR